MATPSDPSPRLFAISDLHVGHPDNRRAVAALPAHPDDWLVLAGDLGETGAQIEWVFATLAPRFRRLVWVPGNHELWTVPDPRAPIDALRGEARYLALCELARRYQVLTPEDPYPVLPGGAPDAPYIAPVHCLYDYTFAPDELAGVGPAGARAWAAEHGVVCTDERLLHPDPYPTREAWCAARVAHTEARLAALPSGARTVLVSHFPLRRDHAVLPLVPRFVPWCGTRLTEQWHRRFNAAAVVSGHLHVRATRWLDGVCFDEVSYGYPRNRRVEAPLEQWLRLVWPRGPSQPDGAQYHRGAPGP